MEKGLVYIYMPEMEEESPLWQSAGQYRRR